MVQIFQWKWHGILCVCAPAECVFLNYGLTSWGAVYKTRLHKVCTKQNRCIRSLFLVNGREHVNSYYNLYGVLKLENIHMLKQEIIKVRELIPCFGPLTKVISLKLVLNIVPSSSGDVNRAMLGQPNRLFRKYLRKNDGKVIQ